MLNLQEGAVAYDSESGPDTRQFVEISADYSARHSVDRVDTFDSCQQ